MNKNFKLVPCGSQAELKKSIKLFEDDFKVAEPALESDPADLWGLSSAVNACFWPVAMWHFGFRTVQTPKDWSDKAMNVVHKFFSQPRGKILNSSEELEWFQSFVEFSLLSYFATDPMECRSAFASFLRADFTVEETAVPIEPALGDIALLIASSYQNAKVSSNSTIARLKKSRKRRPKLLLQAWTAILEDDPESFQSAIEDSIGNFAATTAEDDTPITAIALLESILVSITIENKWSSLSFQEEVAARLLTIGQEVR